MAANHSHLLRHLLRDQKITLDCFHTIYQDLEKQPIHCATYLIHHQILTDQELLHYCATQFHLRIIYLHDIQPSQFQQSIINTELICRHRIIPIMDEYSLLLAVSDPTDKDAIDALAFQADCHTEIVLISESELEQCLRLYFQPQILNEHIETTLAKLPILQEPTVTLYQHHQDEPVTDFVNQLLQNAIEKNVSDIHIEPSITDWRIRFRRDGLLYEAAILPFHLAERVITRLKLMANMDIAEKRLPQDGRLQLSNVQHDIRISTCPLVWGEKLALRLLEKTRKQVELDKLGMTTGQYRLFLQHLTKPQGLILVTGPTGSGKTLTLYAALHYLNQIEKNICTVEDPVEIILPGINQLSVNFKIKLDFATALRALLRQDPDIMMIGEIRDHETAQIAIQAAQTGHLVLSTLHTNSATDALLRLQTLNISPHDLVSSISLIIAQRLVRTLCEHCKICLDERLNTYQALGCEYCYQGYLGRVGLFEMIPMTPEFLQHYLTYPAIPFVFNENHISLHTAAAEKITQGITTANEVRRIIG
jgi:type IV pilus assembly protein PilB